MSLPVLRVRHHGVIGGHDGDVLVCASVGPAGEVVAVWTTPDGLGAVTSTTVSAAGACFPDPAAARPVAARITVHTPELAAVTPIADLALAHITVQPMPGGTFLVAGARCRWRRDGPDRNGVLYDSDGRTATVLALLALRSEKAGKIERMVATVFEPASENGQKGMDELHEQTVNLLSFQELPKNVFDIQVAFNMVPRYGRDRNWRWMQSRKNPNAVGVRRRRSRACAAGAAGAGLPRARLFGLPGDGKAGRNRRLVASPGRARGGERQPGGYAHQCERCRCAGDIQVAIGDDTNHKNGAWLSATTDNLRVAALTAIECAETMTASRPRGQIQ